MCDGAMGTMLYARGVFVNRCFDELNLSNPDLVRARPRRVRRGRRRRPRDQHLRRAPLQARPARLRGAGARRSTARARALAREAAQGRGARGRLDRARWASRWSRSATSRSTTRSRAYREQARGPGRGRRRPLPDRDHAVARPGAGRARRGPRACRDLPVVRLADLQRGGHHLLRRHARGRGARAGGAGASPVVGANCSQGPQPMLETVQRMAAVATTREALGHAQRRRARAGRRAATSTSARPSTWPPTRAASSPPGVDRGGRLLRHDARPHPQPRALGAHGAARRARW